MTDLINQLISNIGYPVLGDMIPISTNVTKGYVHTRVIDNMVYCVDTFIGSATVHLYHYLEDAAVRIIIKKPVTLSYIYEGHVPVIRNPVNDEEFLLLWEKAHG